MFCCLGVSYLGVSGGDSLSLFADIVALLYGIASAAFLGGAWLFSKTIFRPLSQWSAAFVLVLWLVGSLDSWRISGLELWSILGVAFLLSINIVNVRRTLYVRGVAQLFGQAELPPAGRLP
jgi:hypothetical protein